MCSPSYHHNGFVATYALEHMMYSYTLLFWVVLYHFYYDHLLNDNLYYAPCFVCWALFGSLVSVVCNRRLYAQVHELPESHCGDNRKETLLSWLHIYYSHLTSVRLEQSVCRGSLITTHIMLLALLVEYSLVTWHQQCVTVYHVPKCMNWHKAIVVITRRAHCIHDCIYITPILLLLDLSPLCVIDHLWPLILWSLLCLLSTLWLIGTSNV